MKKLSLLILILFCSTPVFSEQFTLLRIDMETYKEQGKVICIYEGQYTTIRDKSTGCLKYIQKI
ncbi:hypothetical protein [Psychromonas sp. MME2]|uniref:hypothetical protein n=1 Tax=unclassified Psychromonas TaxID=2614957 RepID=UPI00339C736D